MDTKTTELIKEMLQAAGQAEQLIQQDLVGNSQRDIWERTRRPASFVYEPVLPLSNNNSEARQQQLIANKLAKMSKSLQTLKNYASDLTFMKSHNVGAYRSNSLFATHSKELSYVIRTLEYYVAEFEDEVAQKGWIGKTKSKLARKSTYLYFGDWLINAACESTKTAVRNTSSILCAIAWFVASFLFHFVKCFTLLDKNACNSIKLILGAVVIVSISSYLYSYKAESSISNVSFSSALSAEFVDAFTTDWALNITENVQEISNQNVATLFQKLQEQSKYEQGISMIENIDDQKRLLEMSRTISGLGANINDFYLNMNLAMQSARGVGIELGHALINDWILLRAIPDVQAEKTMKILNHVVNKRLSSQVQSSTISNIVWAASATLIDISSTFDPQIAQVEQNITSALEALQDQYLSASEISTSAQTTMLESRTSLYKSKGTAEFYSTLDTLISSNTTIKDVISVSFASMNIGSQLMNATSEITNVYKLFYTSAVNIKERDMKLSEICSKLISYPEAMNDNLQTMIRNATVNYKNSWLGMMYFGTSNIEQIKSKSLQSAPLIMFAKSQRQLLNNTCQQMLNLSRSLYEQLDGVEEVEGGISSLMLGGIIMSALGMMLFVYNLPFAMKKVHTKVDTKIKIEDSPPPLEAPIEQLFQPKIKIFPSTVQPIVLKKPVVPTAQKAPTTLSAGAARLLKEIQTNPKQCHTFGLSSLQNLCTVLGLPSSSSSRQMCTDILQKLQYLRL